MTESLNNKGIRLLEITFRILWYPCCHDLVYRMEYTKGGSRKRLLYTKESFIITMKTMRMNILNDTKQNTDISERQFGMSSTNTWIAGFWDMAWPGFTAMNAARGKLKKLGLEKEDMDENDIKVEFSDDAPSKRKCQRTWAQLIHKVYEVNPLICPRCGSEMKVIAFIQEHCEIIKILKHLGLWPVQYPELKNKPARASPLYGKLLTKLSASHHLK